MQMKRLGLSLGIVGLLLGGTATAAGACAPYHYGKDGGFNTNLGNPGSPAVTFHYGKDGSFNTDLGNPGLPWGPV